MILFEKEELVQRAADRFEDEAPEQVLQWAVEVLPNFTLACSFGAEDVVLVDMLQKVSPGKDIFYLDTDLHFPETYETKDRLQEKYGIQFIQVKPLLTLVSRPE